MTAPRLDAAGNRVYGMAMVNLADAVHLDTCNAHLTALTVRCPDVHPAFTRDLVAHLHSGQRGASFTRAATYAETVYNLGWRPAARPPVTPTEQP